VLEEAGKLARDVLAPINWSGDQDGTTRNDDGSVTTANGWKGAYNAYRDGGWNAVPFAEKHGGQELPWQLAFCVQEMWQGANMSFGLCPLLNQGAIEAIEAHGSDKQKDYYLPNMISGQWTGTMNLTEPQAGSDLAVVKSKAEPADDGSYRIFGQKIYITYGEHDLADNIIHLVLARLPDAPEGVKGISLFIVPKILEDRTRNDVKCTGIEHKMGIHASPTCTMQFGVQRMLATMDALTQAGRAMTLEAASLLDKANTGDADARAMMELMTPVVKSWCTDNAMEVTSLGVQVHGGMGFVEETGAAQYMRDARILPIYEGTNGIQAMDLVFRKIMRDDAATLKSWIATNEDFEGIKLVKQSLAVMGGMDQANASWVATSFLNLLGVVMGHIALQKQMVVVDNHEDPKFIANKKNVAEFYKKNILPRALTHSAIVMQGGE